MAVPTQQEFAKRLGAELRDIRQKANASQQEVAFAPNWNRDAISKIERGDTNISLYDYLLVMYFMREFAPDHPAQALAGHLLRVNELDRS